MIKEEIEGQTTAPERKTADLKRPIEKIGRKVSLLLDGLSPETRDLVDEKLRELAAEKKCLQDEMEKLPAASHEPIDPVVVQRVLAVTDARLAPFFSSTYPYSSAPII